MTDEELSPAEYEELVRALVGQLETARGARRIRLDRDVKLQGRCTEHQIDVLWEYEADEVLYRVIFECRRYKSRLKQKDAFAWIGVLRDLAEAGTHAFGVMVTSTGYQKGAKAVAEGHGTWIMELRRPTEADLEGRLLRIELDISVRVPKVHSVNFEAPAEGASGEMQAGSFGMAGPANDTWIRTESGQRLVADVAFASIAQPIGAAERGQVEVRHSYEPPAELVSEGRVITRVTAMVVTGVERIDRLHKTISWGDAVVWMARDALKGRRAWIELGGISTFTDD